MASFERGFKSWAERCAVGLRRELELNPTDPLPPDRLASHLGIRLLTPKDVPGLSADCVTHLLRGNPEGWSAVSFSVGDQFTIIYNPSHSQGRQSSDIMHELAHMIIGHEPSKLILTSDGSMAMRTFDQKQEDEADWLCGCLLLPRVALLHLKERKVQDQQIIEQYRVTASRLKYRVHATAVHRQLGLRRRRQPA